MKNLDSLVEAVASRSNSLSDLTLPDLTEFYKAETNWINVKQDQEFRGHLMNDIYRVSAKLGINTKDLRSLKAMTTSELRAYANELYQQLQDSSYVLRQVA